MSQTPFDIYVRDDLRWDYSKVGKVFVEGDPLISLSVGGVFDWCAANRTVLRQGTQADGGHDHGR